MIHNVVQFGNILCMSFESFGELHFRPTFDAGAVRRCIAIVRAIQADCLARCHAVTYGNMQFQCVVIKVSRVRVRLEGVINTYYHSLSRGRAGF